jgi:hypothetical protein
MCEVRDYRLGKIKNNYYVLSGVNCETGPGWHVFSYRDEGECISETFWRCNLSNVDKEIVFQQWKGFSPVSSEEEGRIKKLGGVEAWYNSLPMYTGKCDLPESWHEEDDRWSPQDAINSLIEPVDKLLALEKELEILNLKIKEIAGKIHNICYGISIPQDYLEQWIKGKDIKPFDR